MAEDKKKYNFLENTINAINKQFISLPDEAVKKNNKILNSFLDVIIAKMKKKDPLFKAMHTNVFYGGSFYDGLRVGVPEEFDLDLLLRLPKYAEPVLTTSNMPGFVHLQLKKFDAWMKQPEAAVAYKNFGKLFEEKTHYLHTTKVLSWMEGLVQKTLNDFPQSGKARILTNNNGRFEIVFCKSGPALTLKIWGPGGVKMMDVDLVACFEFQNDLWPKNGFKPNPVASSKPNFFIVPKRPKSAGNKHTDRYWRLSFQQQERVLIDHKGRLKPTVRLLKKLRDTLGHVVIASYYIKTVLLHIAEKKSNEFWQNPLSYVFMTILKEYREDFIENGRIPYYWNRNNNLIGNISPDTLKNISNRLKVVINDIEKNTDNPKTIAKYLLDSHEYNDFMMGKVALR